MINYIICSNVLLVLINFFTFAILIYVISILNQFVITQLFLFAKGDKLSFN